MRDPKRIEGIMQLLRSYWLRNPELRLGQLIYNVSKGKVFYIEDKEINELLKDKK